MSSQKQLETVHQRGLMCPFWMRPSTACFSHVADEALRLCPYSYEFDLALLTWANGLQWAHNHLHANTSMTELLLNFIFTTGTRRRVNVNRFRVGKRPAYAMRDGCTQDLLLEAFTFAEDLRTFQAALKWFRKRVKVDLIYSHGISLSIAEVQKSVHLGLQSPYQRHFLLCTSCVSA